MNNPNPLENPDKEVIHNSVIFPHILTPEGRFFVFIKRAEDDASFGSKIGPLTETLENKGYTGSAPELVELEEPDSAAGRCLEIELGLVADQLELERLPIPEQETINTETGVRHKYSLFTCSIKNANNLSIEELIAQLNSTKNQEEVAEILLYSPQDLLDELEINPNDFMQAEELRMVVKLILDSLEA